LAIAANEDLEIKQMDFDTAFLNAPITEDIYIKTPKGYNHNVPDGHVLKLQKALYGLKQAPREWNTEITNYLKTLNYIPSDLDDCLFIKSVGKQLIYLTLYVDDTLAVYHKTIEDVWLADKAKISAKYAIKDLGDVEWILNMAIVRDRVQRTITLSQEAYMELLLNEHHVSEGKFVDTPTLYKDLSVAPDGVISEKLNVEDHKRYRSTVGGLLYASLITRLDLSYNVGVLARYTSVPFNYHLAAARRVLQYIKGTTELKLTFRGNGKYNNGYTIEVFTDSDWASEHKDRRSTGGFVVLLF
jgi:hypothetical protein